MTAAIFATAHTATPIYNTTRWADAKGRIWRVLENLHFGRYLCVLADKPSYSGVWTSKEIRAALAKAKGGAA